MNLKKSIIIILLSLSAVAMALEWHEVDHGFKAVVIKDLFTLGEHQIASVEGVSQLYRRKQGELEWKLVYDGHSIDRRGSYDRDYTLIYFNNLLFGARTNSNVGDFDVVSHDSGKTWDTLSEEESDLLRDIDDDIIFGDTLAEIIWGGKEVWASIDNGDNYYTIFASAEKEIRVVKHHKGIFYMGAWGCIYKISDFGDVQKSLVNGLPGRTAINDILIQDSLTLYASTDEGIYRSTDGGENWSIVDDQFTAADFSVMEQLTYCDSTVFGMSKNRVYRLSPSDDHFTEITFPINNDYDRVKLSVFHDNLCIGGFDGVYEYNVDSDEVTLINNGLERISRIAGITANEDNLYATTYSVGGYCSLLKATNGNNFWDTLYTAKCSSLNFGQNDNYLRLSYESIGDTIYYYSDDYGASWDKREYTPNPLFNGEIIDSENDTLYHKRSYDENHRVEFSVDQGQSWDTLITFDDNNIRFLYKSENRMFFTVMVYPPNQTGYNVLSYSDDNGETLTSYNDPYRRMATMVKSQDGTLLIGGSRKAAYSTDNGNNWTSFDSIPISGVLSLYDSIAIGYNIYSAGKYHRARDNYFYSTNYGKTWQNLPSTIGEGTLSDFRTGAEVVRNSSTVYCIEAGCIYKIDASKLTEVTSVVVPKSGLNNIKSLFATHLSPNAINIKLNLKSNERFTVRLYTPSGRIIESAKGITKHNGESVRIASQRLSKGYYILQVCGENRKEASPFLLK